MSNTIRFKNKKDLSLYIEKIKLENDFETYIEAISYFYENESDSEMEDITKMLNQKILDNIADEAQRFNLTKYKESETGKLL